MLDVLQTEQIKLTLLKYWAKGWAAKLNAEL